MSDVRVTCIEIGHNVDHNGWRYDFLVDIGSKEIMNIPIIVPDYIPEEDRRDVAIKNFRELIDAVAGEAKSL